MADKNNWKRPIPDIIKTLEKAVGTGIPNKQISEDFLTIIEALNELQECRGMLEIIDDHWTAGNFSRDYKMWVGVRKALGRPIP